jgi:hypothetical protein
MLRAAHQGCFMIGIAARALTGALGLLISCGCTHYGGTTFPIRIIAEPDQNKAIYLIPDQVWTTYPESFRPDPADPAHQELNERLLQYRIHDDGTKEVDSITYDVVIWNGNQLIAIDQITPREPGQELKVSTTRMDNVNP